MTILEDWPSLPPIRTSSGRDSRVSCETLSLQDSSQSKPLPGHTFDSFFPLSASDDGSLPSSATSAFVLRGHLFSCFFPNKSASHAMSRSMMSPGRDGRKGSSDVAAVFRSFVGFSGGPMHQSGSLVHSGAVAHSGKAVSGPISGHPSLKGYTVNSKGHAANVFTMMPPDVVGKKKPPGYESDEPTSPEVTCVGRVRRKKQCKAWDALVKESKSGDRKSKGKKGLVSPRSRFNFVLASPRADVQLQSPRRPMPSRRKQPVLHGSETETPLVDRHRESDTEFPSSDQDPFNLSSRSPSRVNNSDIGVSSQFQSEGENSDAANEEFPYQPPPPNCLLRMRNTGHSKDHNARGELLGIASKIANSTEDKVGSKPSKDNSLWKRRMAKSPASKLELKAKQ